MRKTKRVLAAFMAGAIVLSATGYSGNQPSTSTTVAPTTEAQTQAEAAGEFTGEFMREQPLGLAGM